MYFLVLLQMGQTNVVRCIWGAFGCGNAAIQRISEWHLGHRAFVFWSTGIA